YEMLTGAPPYLADSVAHVLQQHMEAEPPTIQERGGACSADLESVIRRCLAKKPEDRYPSAQALIAELAQAS
ncbi:MAG: serine/threonine protein kinase, partial [Myxococcales bacterium]|nr:serine/threonine protein kinase [Myxococcales bacterium]